VSASGVHDRPGVGRLLELEPKDAVAVRVPLLLTRAHVAFRMREHGTMDQALCALEAHADRLTREQSVEVFRQRYNWAVDKGERGVMAIAAAAAAQAAWHDQRLALSVEVMVIDQLKRTDAAAAAQRAEQAHERAIRAGLPDLAARLGASRHRPGIRGRRRAPAAMATEFHAALVAYDEVLGSGQVAAEPPLHAHLANNRGLVLYLCGRHADAIEALTLAGQLFEAIAEPVRATRAGLHRARIWLKQGQVAEALEVAERGAQEADPWCRALAARVAGEAALRLDGPEAAAAWAQTGLAAMAAGAPGYRACFLALRLLCTLDVPQEWWDDAVEALADTWSAADLDPLAAHVWLAQALERAGDARAVRVRMRGRRLLQSTAAAIGDAEARSGFMRCSEAHRWLGR
jgi:hypothetical protein